MLIFARSSLRVQSRKQVYTDDDGDTPLDAIVYQIKYSIKYFPGVDSTRSPNLGNGSGADGTPFAFPHPAWRAGATRARASTAGQGNSFSIQTSGVVPPGPRLITLSSTKSLLDDRLVLRVDRP